MLDFISASGLYLSLGHHDSDDDHVFLNSFPTFMYSLTRAELSRINFDSLRFRFPNVHFSSSVRDLGCIIDPLSI